MLVVCWLQGFSLESACLLGIVQQQLATICHYCVAQSYAAIANTFHMYIPPYSRGLLYIVVLSFNQATTFPQSFPNFVLDSLFVASSCCNVCKIFAITLYQFWAKFLLVLKGEERVEGSKWDAHYCWHYFGQNGIRSVRSASSFWCRKVFLQALIVINIMYIHFRCPYLWHFPPPPTHTHTHT